MSAARVGIMLPCALPPERLHSFARDAQTAGLDELWVVEDCFFTGGIAAAATALAVTDRLSVGIGILPVRARNAAFAAMEIATLERLAPGRVLAGMGHGMADWMEQVGATAASPLRLLEETLSAVRALLSGVTVTAHGDYVRLDDVALAHPPVSAPPVLAGVRGPRSLEVSGRVADGTILAEPVTAAYIEYAREHIALGTDAAGRSEHHPITAYSIFRCGSDGDAARASAETALANALGPSTRAHLIGLAAPDQLLECAHNKRSGAGGTIAPEIVEQLTVSGTPADCARRIAALHRGGADSVVLIPSLDSTEHFAEVAPLLGQLRATAAPPAKAVTGNAG